MAKRSRKAIAKLEEKTQKRQALDKELGADFGALADNEEEFDYESVPRRFKEDADDEALPVIVDGQVHRRKQKGKKRPEELEESGSEASSDESPTEEEEEEDQEHELLEMSLVDLKEQIAEYAQSINEEPEEHISKINELQKLAAHTRSAKQRQILIISLLKIYKDVIPGYRILPLTDAQQKEKVSKEVRKLRDFEQRLIQYYHHYIQLLTQFYNQGKSAQKGSKYLISCTSVNIACDLLASVPFFNYREDLIKLMTHKLSSSRVDSSFTKNIDTINKVFEDDNEGFVSFDIVRALAKMIKARHYRVNSEVLSTLVNLRLLTELVGRADLERLVKEKPKSDHIKKKDRVHLTKKERKQRKENKEIEEEMRKAETRVSAEMREKLQAQTLKLVFVLYFNILKVRSKTLVPATLEGLAKFAHLMNADLFGDLLEVVRQIITEQEKPNTRESLLCIITAFALLNGQGNKADSMNLDLTFFVNHFYKVLFDIAENPHIEQPHKHLKSAFKGEMTSEMDMLVKAFESIFTKRVIISQARAMAFAKRLAICALNFPEKTALIAFNILNQILKRHPQTKALLFTQDRIVKGQYIMYADIPEHSNAQVSTLWEIDLLSRHYNPNVSLAARQLRNITE